MKKRAKFILHGIIISLAMACLIYFITSHIYIFEDFEFKTLDLRFKLRGKTQAEKNKEIIFEDIVIVDIDEISLDKLGKFYDWPRSYHGQALNYISLGEPKAIGFDILFIEEDKDITQDQALCDDTMKARKVVHSYFMGGKEKDEVVNLRKESFFKNFSYPMKERGKVDLLKNKFASLPIPSLTEASGGLGYLDTMPDDDGIVRNTYLIKEYKGRVYPSFALEIIRLYLGAKKEEVEILLGKYIKIKEIKIPIDKTGRMLINYKGPTPSYRYISYHWVLEKRVPCEVFKDKIVLFGTSAPGLMDLRSSPFSPAYPGVEIHANIIKNIKDNTYLVKVSEKAILCLVIFLGILVGFFSASLSLMIGILVVFLILLSYLILILYYFNALNIWLPCVQPLMVIFFSFLGNWIYRYRFEEKEKKKIRSIFEKYVSFGIVNEILNNPEGLKLGGEKKEVTILFSDIRKFTTMSEQLLPEKVVFILNRYFTSMSKIIFEYEGTLDKFIGDGIMAFYGAPIYTPDHTKKAVFTALKMREELKRLNEEFKREDISTLNIGIGINTGEVVVGNIGSKERMEYTVIGDNVNLCSRLQSLSQEGQIIISESTYQKIKDLVEVIKLEAVKVKGKKDFIQVYEVIKLKE
ncbi:MAG: adenylate/guanylate cyclase domain-containing protein [bacterium]